MDFLNPRKQRRYKIQLLVGYVLIVIAIFLTVLILLFLAYGYSLGKNGQIIQNGLVFVSSTPNPAKIYLNGVLNKSSTNSRLQLPAGQYTMKLTRQGYRPWVRAVGVEGGSVERFDYPFLFPTKLVTTDVQQYASQPGLVLQSPDQHWLLVQEPGSNTDFDEYDLTNQKQLVSTMTTLNLPAGLVTDPKAAGSWQLVAWAADSQHVLLQHDYSGGSEYIMFDRQTPADSVNLTNTLNLSPTTELTLDNEKYDQYYLYNTADDSLSTASLTTPTPVAVLGHVLDFKTYGNNIILYATTTGAPTGQVDIDVLDGSQNYVIRRTAPDATYLLNLTQYNGNWYVACGSPNENEVYIYENPMADLQNQPTEPLVPIDILRVNQPNYLAFSANAQFIMTENDGAFAVFDAQNDKSYSYKLNVSLVAGQHATWMDGDRLILTTEGHVMVWDYDDANPQTLQPATDGSLPMFDAPYKWVYVIAPAPVAPAGTAPTYQFALTSTALRIPADQ